MSKQRHFDRAPPSGQLDRSEAGPVRTCVGCGHSRPKRELLRIGSLNGELTVDVRAALPGRGSYVCSPKCAERALEKQSFSRALRGSKQLGSPDRFLAEVRTRFGV